MPSSPFGPSEDDIGAASSSRNHMRQAAVEDDDDDLDGLDHTDDLNDKNLLHTDPLDADWGNTISFKRKQKSTSGFALPKFLSSPLSGNSRQASPAPQRAFHKTWQRRDTSTDHSPDITSRIAGTSLTDITHLQDTKDGNPLDWYQEGPGRRVGYDDLTAIDWIFEYTKERQRLRFLRSTATGLIGYLQQLADASQVWFVLIATGIAVGLVAAGIDISSDWLGDLKTGYCKNGQGGGKFYLNKSFCCWGDDEWSQCQDWTPWGDALHVASHGGRFVVEYIFYVMYSVLFAACACILVRNYASYAKHSGIPEIKTVLGGFVIRRFMGAWTLIIKSLGLCLAVASGLWLGKEGPLVHVACCCANIFMKLSDTLSNNEARKREVLSAAAAAGISVAFGAPIGGVLFSLEQLSYYFPDKTMWQSFVCAMVAAVALQASNPFRTGKLVLYQVTYSNGWHGFEIVPFLFLGITGGVYGGLFINANMKVAKFRRSSFVSNFPFLEVVIVALLSAVVNFPNLFMRAQSSELVYSLFAECLENKEDPFGLCKTGAENAASVTLLLFAACGGFFLACVTFGMEIPAGIILPSMAIGALFGRALGHVVEVAQRNHSDSLIFSSCEPDIPCITPGTYAIIGAAAALAGVTRMTVSIVVIMFELTGALTYVLPIMIAVMVSKWVGDAFGKKGIYESWIHFKEYPYLDNRDDTPIPDITVSDIMTRIEDLVVLTATGHTIQTLQDLLNEHAHRGFPVISDTREAILLGYISRTELAFALNSARSPPHNLPSEAEAFFSHQPLADPEATLDLRPWMDQTPITLSAKSTLQLTANLFQKLGLRYIILCDRGALQGLMTKKDLWYVLNTSEGGSVRARSGTNMPDLRGDSSQEAESDLLNGNAHGVQL